MKKEDKNLIEILANIEHIRWAKWQKYFFSKCIIKPQHEVGGMDDRFVYFSLSKDLFERWNRQIETPYSGLSEGEKDSDRKEALITLEAIDEYENSTPNLLKTITT
jgi:hypothetical protein